jgi:DNA end-binding protein Ku
MALRSIQSNMLSFGLVNIPVKVFSASESGSKISFNQLHAEKHTRLKQQMYDPETGAVVAKENIVKGYEFAKDQYVVFTAEELAALDAESDKRMEIVEFVPAESVDPIYLDTLYYLGPDKGAERSFRLLTATLKETKRVAVVRYAARSREHVALIRPLGDGLALQQLRYADEVRDPAEVEVPEATLKPEEMALAKLLVEAQTSEAFVPSKYKDDYQEKLKVIIDKKVKGEPIPAPVPVKTAGPALDLMAALTASLKVSPKVEPIKAEPAPAAKPAKGKKTKVG